MYKGVRVIPLFFLMMAKRHYAGFFFGYHFAAADSVQIGDYENQHQRFEQSLIYLNHCIIFEIISWTVLNCSYIATYFILFCSHLVNRPDSG